MHVVVEKLMCLNRKIGNDLSGLTVQIRRTHNLKPEITESIKSLLRTLPKLVTC